MGCEKMAMSETKGLMEEESGLNICLSATKGLMDQQSGLNICQCLQQRG